MYSSMLFAGMSFSSVLDRPPPRGRGAVVQEDGDVVLRAGWVADVAVGDDDVGAAVVVDVGDGDVAGALAAVEVGVRLEGAVAVPEEQHDVVEEADGDEVEAAVAV